MAKAVFMEMTRLARFVWAFLGIREESRAEGEKRKCYIHVKSVFLSVLHKAALQSFRQCIFRILVSGVCNFLVFILTGWPSEWHGSCLNPSVFRLKFIYSVRQAQTKVGK